MGRKMLGARYVAAKDLHHDGQRYMILHISGTLVMCIAAILLSGAAGFLSFGVGITLFNPILGCLAYVSSSLHVSKYVQQSRYRAR